MDLLRKYRQDSPDAGADSGPPGAGELPSMAGLAGGGGGDGGGAAAGAIAAPWPDYDPLYDPLDPLEGPDVDPEPPERLPVPDGLNAPCRACEGQGRGPNPLFWQDRFDAIHCAGCRPCPSRVMFRRFLQLKGVAGDDGKVPAGGRWLEERELDRNPWLRASGASGGAKEQAEPAGVEGY